MKSSILMVWNIALSIGIVILFLLYTGKKTPVTVAPPADNHQPNIAFINLDSLETHYEFFSEKKKELDQKQQQMQDQYNKKLTAFQSDYQSAQKASATMTQDELKKTSDHLQQEQNEIQQMQSDLQTQFQEQLDSFNRSLKDSLDSFLKYYNTQKKYDYIFSFAQGSNLLIAAPQFDITPEAIKGMNDRMKKP